MRLGRSYVRSMTEKVKCNSRSHGMDPGNTSTGTHGKDTEVNVEDGSPNPEHDTDPNGLALL